MFINKLFDVTCTTVQRLAYNMRDIIRKEDLPMEQICKVSIDLLLEILDIMDRVSIFLNYLYNLLFIYIIYYYIFNFLFCNLYDIYN